MLEPIFTVFLVIGIGAAVVISLTLLGIALNLVH